MGEIWNQKILWRSGKTRKILLCRLYRLAKLENLFINRVNPLLILGLDILLIQGLDILLTQGLDILLTQDLDS